MTGTSAGRSAPTEGTSERAAEVSARRRGLRRLFAGPAALERSSRRAGREPFPAVLSTPRVWVALG